jgi:hypothetical protein
MPVGEMGTKASTDGWVEVEGLPGNWAQDPDGEWTRPYVRVVNGTFNEHPGGFDTTLDDDRAALIYPFTFRC